MSQVRDQLERETATWRARLDESLTEASALTERGTDFLENVRAYRKDCDHFEDTDDPVRAFEAIVWAWAWLEIGARTEDIDWAYPDSWDGPQDPRSDDAA